MRPPRAGMPPQPCGERPSLWCEELADRRGSAGHSGLQHHRPSTAPARTWVRSPITEATPSPGNDDLHMVNDRLMIQVQAWGHVGASLNLAVASPATNVAWARPCCLPVAFAKTD